MNKWVLHIHEDNSIIIQRVDYIEYGAYIKVIGKNITVYEIPQFGGSEQLIKECSSLQEAFQTIEKLT